MSVKAVLKPIPVGHPILKHNPLKSPQSGQINEQLEYIRRVLSNNEMSDEMKIIFSSEHLNKMKNAISKSTAVPSVGKTLPIKVKDTGTDVQPANIEILQPLQEATFLDKTIDQNPFSSSTPTKKPPKKRRRKRTVISPSKIRRSDRIHTKPYDPYDKARKILAL